MTEDIDDTSDDLLPEHVSVPLGTHRDRRVFVAATRQPSDAPAPDEFSLNVYIPNETGENVDIVRIDTAHAGLHIDRLYFPESDRRRHQDYSIDGIYSPEDALAWLIDGERWRTFVDEYAETHGLPPRGRDDPP